MKYLEDCLFASDKEIEPYHYLGMAYRSGALMPRFRLV
jgi:hypothetical protein